MARRHWSGDALNKSLTIGETRYVVVGVAGDVRHRSLTELGTADPDAYLSFAQVPSSGFAFALRLDERQAGIINAIRTTIHEMDATVPCFGWRGEPICSSSKRRARASAPACSRYLRSRRSCSRSWGSTACCRSSSAARRDRSASAWLGAGASDIVRLIVRRAVSPIATGVAVGLAGAFAATQLLTTLLYGVSSTDPLTFIATPLVLASVALLACYGPARRATRMNPVVALRSE